MSWFQKGRDQVRAELRGLATVYSVAPTFGHEPVVHTHGTAHKIQPADCSGIPLNIERPRVFHGEGIGVRPPETDGANLALPLGRTGRLQNLGIAARALTRPCSDWECTAELRGGIPIIAEARASSVGLHLPSAAHTDSPSGFGAETHSIGCAIETCPVAILKRIALAAEIHAVSVVIGRPSRQSYSFERHDHEPRPLHTGRQLLTRPATPLPRVEAPPAAPMERLSIRETLLWLLTPPIDELLGDPQIVLPGNPYPFQMYGIKWLLDRDSALLADEMGLGKTIQAILAARLLFRGSHISEILIICPKSLTPNWEAELRKWWPNVEFHVHVAGPTIDRRKFLSAHSPSVVVKIINYEKLAKEIGWIKGQNVRHDLVIIDEAQNIKNPSSGKAQAVKSLVAKRRWAITGTPLENRLDDVISIFGFVKPGLLKDRDDQEVVRKRINPYFLRRRAEEVLTDLPELIDETVQIELSSGQIEAYERMERNAVVELNAKGDSITVQHVFAQIMKLKQLCNFDPRTGESAKFERLLTDFDEISPENRKALVFSQFVEQPFGLKTVAARLAEKGPALWDKSLTTDVQ